MNDSIYTLLIVESPVQARIIQNLAPSSVYVLSTGGFCWKPDYDHKNNRLKAVAVPEKTGFRKELRKQARWANSVVLALDPDPSGEFIAWSVSKFLKSGNLKNGQIRHLSRNSIEDMLTNLSELDESVLETRLKNRFLVQFEWNQTTGLPPMQRCGIAAVLGAAASFTTFFDENGKLYRSSQPLICTPDEWLAVRPAQQKEYFSVQKPLSTFDLIERVYNESSSKRFSETTELLQELFQTLLPYSEESLISYPRTNAQAFYSETWDGIRNQYINIAGINDLKPTFLQEIAGEETPHESIHPLDLTKTPESVSGQLNSMIASLYRTIYDATLQAIKIPGRLEHAYVNDLNPDIHFYSLEDENRTEPQTLCPCITISDFGSRLNQLGVTRPSSFASSLERWNREGWIQLKNNRIRPGRRLSPYLENAAVYFDKLRKLKDLAQKPHISPETVREVISS